MEEYNKILTRWQIRDDKKEICKNEEMYKDNIEAYKEYLENVKFLVKTISVPNNAISSSIVLRNLIDFGVLSEGRVFQFGDDPEQIKGYEDMSIIKGIGSEKNISLFNAKVLTGLDLLSDVFYADKAFKDDPNYAYGKQIINLIEYHNNLYGYDSVNDSLYCFIHDGVMMEMFKKRPNYLIYDWYNDMLYNGTSYEGTVNLRKLYDKYKNKRLISLDEYKAMHFMADNLTYGNENLANDFNNSHKKQIRRITYNLK